MTVDYKIEFENERAKFQAETLVTSRLYQEIAELRSKPAALDAEVREAVDLLWDNLIDSTKLTDHECDELEKAYNLIVRAASAVQEVTVEELVAEITKESNLQSKVFKFESYHWYFAAETILNKYPNGLKLVKEKK